MKKTKLLKYLKFMGKKTTQKILRIMYWKLSKNCVVHVSDLYCTIYNDYKGSISCGSTIYLTLGKMSIARE